MSGFELAPAEGGCPVALPPGETVLGRGALLGITDKRVSRKHAILKVAGNHLSIKPVHVNPCFYQPTENSEILPLDTDKWHQLSPGDSFSLLVDKYAFRVLFTPLDVETQRKNCHLHVEDRLNQASSVLQPTRMPHSQPPVQQATSSKKSQLLDTHLLLEKAAEIPKEFSASIPEIKESQPAKRKRLLPAWMLQDDLMVQSQAASVSGKENSDKITKGSGKKRKMNESEDTSLATQDMPEISQELERELEKNESKMMPQRAGGFTGQSNYLLENEELDLSPQDIQACQLTETDTNSARENKLEDKSFKTEHISQDKPSQSPGQKGEIQELTQINQTTKTDISNLTRSQKVLQNSNISSHQRRACQYGRNCYRKNPTHFQQFSHPGDSDYPDTESVTEAHNDNRPECPYGTACYRKNPQHKLEYKHTAPPESEKREMRPKATKKGKGNFLEDSDNDGEPNEYDQNDSFIDDEEEEEFDPTDEDSDWEPDFQDQDNEDVDTLLKEAQNFVKTKK